MKQPDTLEICTVATCSNACDYCPQHKLTHAYKKNLSRMKSTMELDTFKKCIDKLPNQAWVDFSGFVEPFLNDCCADMMLYAHKKKHPIRVFTTLVGMTKEDVLKIKSIGFIRFTIHLPDNFGVMKAEVDDNYCDVFDYLLKNFVGATAMCFGPLHEKLKGIVKKNNLNVKFKELNSSNLGTRANNVKNKNYVQLEPYLRKRGKLFCKPIFQKNNGANGRFNHNVLLTSGDVVLCCSDYGLTHCLGNLLTDNYDDLFLSSEYNRIMRGLNDESIDILCRTCEHAVTI